MASQSLERLGLTSAVAAPKDLLLENLNSTLKSYLLVTLAVALLSLMAAFIISRAVTRPIDTMIFHINEISKGTEALFHRKAFTRNSVCGHSPLTRCCFSLTPITRIFTSKSC